MYENQNIFYEKMPFKINLEHLVDKDQKILNKVKKNIILKVLQILGKKR